MAENENWVRRTVSNMKALIAATEAKKIDHLPGEPFPRTEGEKQQLHVDASTDRCRRCGDYTPILVADTGPLVICRSCEAELKASDGGAMWFTDMLAKLSKAGEKAA